MPRHHLPSLKSIAHRQLRIPSHGSRGTYSRTATSFPLHNPRPAYCRLLPSESAQPDQPESAEQAAAAAGVAAASGPPGISGLGKEARPPVPAGQPQVPAGQPQAPARQQAAPRPQQQQQRLQQAPRRCGRQRSMALFSYLQMAVTQPMDLLMRGRIREQYYSSEQLKNTRTGANAGVSG